VGGWVGGACFQKPLEDFSLRMGFYCKLKKKKE
jgi:hypothetical protein